MSRGSNHNTDSKRYYDWLYHSYLDYLAAKNLISDKRCNCAVAFHCQQCIEKALKGYLLFKNHRLFDGHNLTWLCKQAALLDQEFKKYLVKSANLNRFYIETRYPADIPMEIGDEEIKDLILSAEEMMYFIMEQIKFDFKSYHKRRH